MNELPISSHLGSIVETLLGSSTQSMVLTAETAAGKSTAVPQAFLDAVPGKILMLEPRRVAAFAIASRISEVLGETLGQTAGYRMRMEARIGPNTRIEIITEAILTRMIQDDPSLEGVSVVILDEFHERSIHGDLALAFLKEALSLREDLFVLVMSATIDTEKIAAYLGGAPVLHVSGRVFPVEVRYRAPVLRRDGKAPYIWERCAEAIRDSLSHPGSILVFLPGLYEIKKTQSLLSDLTEDVRILHGSIPFEEQRSILTPPREGSRRIILSSAIAETSITVPGVSLVIDSGLSRISRYDPQTGMDTLVTEIESAFSAAQRSGRAGRLGPGQCIRLWAEQDVRIPESSPEIARSDLVPLVLECALWGVSNRDGLSWLDPPNPGSWMAGKEILQTLGALDHRGGITDKGRAIASLGVHPRIAAVALGGSPLVAATYARADAPEGEIRKLSEDLIRRMGRIKASVHPGPPGRALLEGFPDRLARHVNQGVYQFPSGRLASLPGEERSSTAVFPEWIVAPEVDSGEREGKIRAWEILNSDEARSWAEAHGQTTVDIAFAGNEIGGKLKKTERLWYGKLLLKEKPLPVEQGDAKGALAQAVREKGLDALPLDDGCRSFIARATFAQIDVDAELHRNPEEWLLPFVPPAGQLTGTILLEALRYRLEGRRVDAEAPLRIDLANGLSRPLVYEELVPGEGAVPILEIRIQELFGCPDTPRVRGVPVLLRLLSPARRPVQITRDLAGFWDHTWKEVRKEMKGRYPKHKWPEDPRILPPKT